MKTDVKRLYQSDLRRALRSWELPTGIALIPVLIALDNPYDFMAAFNNVQGLSVIYFYMHSVVYGGLLGTYLLSTLCTLPYARRARAELDSNYALYQIAMTGDRTYLKSKYLAAG